MTADLPPVRRPAAPPSPSDLAERDRYAALAAESLATARASARTWRNGLAAFITLVTTGVIIKGRDNTADLATGWRIAVTALIAGGLALAVLGLWQALIAEAGTGTQIQTLDDIRARYLTLDAYRVSLAAEAARRLQWGRYAVAGALACLLVGVIVTWWAPAKATASTAEVAYVTVAHGGKTACGALRAASHGQLQLIADGTQQLITVPLGIRVPTLGGHGPSIFIEPCCQQRTMGRGKRIRAFADKLSGKASRIGPARWHQRDPRRCPATGWVAVIWPWFADTSASSQSSGEYGAK